MSSFFSKIEKVNNKYIHLPFEEFIKKVIISKKRIIRENDYNRHISKNLIINKKLKRQYSNNYPDWSK